MSTTLKFCVRGQRITRADAIVTVADAINYIYAEFAFCSDWDGLVKTAVFTRGSASYEALLDQNGRCLVPYEVLEDGPGIFKVSVFGGNLITTAPVKVRIDASGWSFALESSQPPTPSVYQQIIDRMDGIETEMETATAAAEASAVLAESYAKGGTSTRQGEDTDNARYYSEQASGSAEEAAQIVQDFDDDVVAGAIALVEAAGTEQVGAVNSAGTTQVGAVEGAGSTQVAAVNSAGSTQIGLVRAKGTEQVAAVQAKGTEVIGSIPQDYSELTGEVGELKSALTQVSKVGTQLFDKDNPDIINAFCTSDKTVTAANAAHSVIVAIPENDASYITIHKGVISSRFDATTFTTKPVVGSVGVEIVEGSSSDTSLTIPIDSTIKYILIYVYNTGADTTITLSDVLNGLMVQFGSTYTGYKAYSLEVIIPDKSIDGDSFSDDGVDFITDIINECTTDDQILINGNKKTSINKNDLSLTWTEGGYYNFSTGEITALSGYAYSLKMDCAEGDRITITNNKGQIVFWKKGGVFYGYSATDYPGSMTFLVPDDVVKFALNNLDSTIRASSATVRTTTEDVIVHSCDAPAKLLYNGSAFEQGLYCLTTNGKMASVASYSCLPYVPVKPNHKYRTQTQTQVVFYDSSLAFISALLPGGAAQNTGTTVEMDFTTPATCKYISVNTLSEHEMLFDLEYNTTGYITNPQKLSGLSVLSFGDSITGNYGFGDNIIYEVEKHCGAKTFNCGFGGCRMEKISESGSAAETAALTNPFAMCELVDQLALSDSDTNKWSAQDAAAAQFEASPRYNRIIKFRLGILKTIDLANIDIVTIAYGTNETGYTQENPNDKYDKYTYGGATRYSIEKLLEINPKLRIVLLAPIYRHSFGSGSGDSDSYVNSETGLSMADNINTLKAVGLEYKIPVVDMYHDLGIDAENYQAYFGDDDETDDGTHINSYGRKTYGVRLAGELSRLF